VVSGFDPQAALRNIGGISTSYKSPAKGMRANPP
jgi:hypothetical protein